MFIKRKLLLILILFIFGSVSGCTAKYIEDIPHIGTVGDILNVLGNIGSRIGVWVFIATIISCWSITPKEGALHVFAFFCGMLLAYYTYSAKMFGFFPTYYFLRWGLIALVSPLAAYIVWFGRGQGWVAAICAALPIGLLIAQGYHVFYTLSAVPGFDLLAGLALFLILPTKKYQRIKAVPFIFFFAFAIRYSNLLSYLIGGL